MLRISHFAKAGDIPALLKLRGHALQRRRNHRPIVVDARDKALTPVFAQRARLTAERAVQFHQTLL
jgi:hypothetical protein